MADPVTLIDGSVDWSLGVSSVKTTTIASDKNPNGLSRNELAWLTNGTTRDGGITCRLGWHLLGDILPGNALYQGGFLYEPTGDFPIPSAPPSGSGTTVYLDGKGNPVYSRGTLVGTKALAPNDGFIVPAQGATGNMTLQAPFVGVVGDPVTLYRVSDNAPWGEYVVTNIAGNVVTLQTTYAPGITGVDSSFPIQLFNPTQTPVIPPVAPTVITIGNPYLILSIGGRIYKVFPDDATHPIDLSAISGLTNPANVEQAYFCQGEQFLVIQAGDNVTRPLFWDGLTLRRSNGITGNLSGPNVNELPPATAMDYYEGRLWYTQGRTFSAGDIVNGPSGTAPYRYRDSILKVTENPLAIGGDGFTVPSNAGNIRALKHSANLDNTLGQSQLFIGTRKTVYSLDVPITRASWIAADASNRPVMKVVQIANGMVNDRSVVAVNGDLYFQSLEPGIRSLVNALRYFNQPGNRQISANEQRILIFNDRALLHAASGIVFDNRLLQTALPTRKPQGIVHQAIIPLDFIPISSFGAQKDPIWGGAFEGLDTFQMFNGEFGGLDRAFAVVCSRKDGDFELWEFSAGERFDFNDTGESRVTWIVEFPAYTFGEEFLLKKLVSAEIWIDRLFGTVDFQMEYRPDSDACYQIWHKWQVCSARNSCEDTSQNICYPLAECREGYRSSLVLPKPPNVCQSATGRPAYIGFQFQCRLTIKGWCRIRGMLLKSEPLEKALYQGLICPPSNTTFLPW